MKSLAEIQAALSEVRDELDAIISVAERETRDLSEEETARVTQITDSLIPTLNDQLKTATKIKQERDARGAKRFYEEIEAQNGKENVDTSTGKISRFGSIKIPAKAKVHGPLRAYQGEDAQRDADRPELIDERQSEQQTDHS